MNYNIPILRKNDETVSLSTSTTSRPEEQFYEEYLFLELNDKGQPYKALTTLRVYKGETYEQAHKKTFVNYTAFKSEYKYKVFKVNTTVELVPTDLQ